MQLSARVLLVIAFAAGRASAAQAPAPSAPSFATLSTQAQTARDANQFEKAVDLYKRALKLKPNWEDGLWSLGSIEYDLKQYKDCTWAFDKLSELKPDLAPGWTMAGLCEYGLHNYGSALDDFARVETLKFEENAELARVARLHYGLVLTKTGMFEKAINILADLTREKHKTPETIVAIGIAGLRRPWLPSEVPESERDAIYRLGDAMSTGMEQDYKVARQKFEDVLKAYPSDPNIHFRYGAMLCSLDDDQGVEEIKKAIALEPDHVPALVSMSALSLKREDSEAAVQYGELAVKVSPGDFATHVVLGRALLASEDPARAAAELEQAVKLAPNSIEGHYSLAEAYNHLGKKAEAAREQAEFKRLEHLGGKQVP
jgi:tetratricopeptide (TPR) repeat protein